MLKPAVPDSQLFMLDAGGKIEQADGFVCLAVCIGYELPQIHQAAAFTHNGFPRFAKAMDII